MSQYFGGSRSYLPDGSRAHEVVSDAYMDDASLPTTLETGTYEQTFATGEIDSDDETGLGQTRLFSILEEAVPRPEEARTRSVAEASNRKELVEQTWERVRKWLWSHPDVDQRRAAAYVRGQADATPLHVVCKLSNPPSDIVQALVECAPETASWTDSHGWLPLHHACAAGASAEVLFILMDAFPEGKTKQDKQFRTPLHFYTTRRAENSNTMADNVVLLSDSGAAELPDRGGMLPMHYACAYGTSPAVLAVLANAYPESLVAKENKGRTPMHLAMVNAHRAASPGVIRFLLDSHGADAVNMRDHEGYLPLHLLALGLKGFRANEPDRRQNVAECLTMYLGAKPQASADFLTALQDLPEWLQDAAVESPHVRAVLNEKIVQRFPTMFLMLDGYILLLLIVCFELTTRNHVDSLFTKDDGDPATNTAIDTTVFLVFVFLSWFYFLCRELVQVVSLWSLGSISSWFWDATNWLDMAVIVLVFYYSILMATGTVGISNEVFRSGVALTKGVLWCAVISFLKSTLVDFAVFVGGVFYVLQRLFAFLMAVSIILLAFAQMFFIVYTETPICDDAAVADCEFPHCTFPKSLLKVYTMMMGEIGDETRYETSLVAQLLYVAYAFLVVILLSNVLIAIVTDSYEIIQNDRAAVVFWSNRLDWVAEMDVISYTVKRRMNVLSPGGAPGAPTDVQESPSGPGLPISPADPRMSSSTNKDTTDYFREGWDQIMLLFDPNLYDDIDLHPNNIEFWCYFFFQTIAVVFVIPIWIFLGFATAGWLWPPQIREFLFVQADTAVSRADIEKQKLEQLKEIQNDIKMLKGEIKVELAEDRDQMVRLKAEVETTQSEITSDLQQVRELMTTLLDMSRGRSV